VLARDADAAVGDLEDATALRAQLPGHGHAPALGRIAHRVAGQVDQRRQQLGGAAGNLRPLLKQHVRRRKDQFMAPGRQRTRLDLDLLEQVDHRCPLVRRRRRPALQPRQRQQVTDERPHAPGLLPHQAKQPVPVRLAQRQRHHRLDEADQRGQRRADLVRDVGDEVAPHSLAALLLGDVLRQHEMLPRAVGAHRHRQRQPALVVVEHERRRRLAGLQRRDEQRCAHKVGDALTDVALRIEPEVHGRHLAEPDDLAVGIEQQHAVGRRLDGAQELAQAFALGAHGRLALAHRPLDAVGHLAPQLAVARRRAFEVATQPGHQPPGTAHVAPAGQQHADHRAEPGAQDRFVEATPDQTAHQRHQREQQHRRQQAPHHQGHHGITTAASPHQVGDRIRRVVLHVGALDDVDDLLGEVLGVVADTLDRLGDEHQIDRRRDGARVFHHVGDELAHQTVELAVDLVVLAEHVKRLRSVEPRERVERLAQQVDRQRRLVRDVTDRKARPAGHAVLGQLLHGAGDAGSLVANALQVADRLGHRDQQAQVARGRLTTHDDRRQVAVDLHLVDALLGADHLGGQLGTALRQRLDRLGDLGLDQSTHLEHAGGDAAELGVKLAGNVLVHTEDSGAGITNDAEKPL
jgi:hypothetical protein